MCDVRHVLIVEDDRKTAELLSCFLKKEGFETALAHDGRAGLSLFTAVQPALVILDAMLPEVDGFALCAAIRRQSQIPILFLTARDEESDVILGLGLGADDYVVKPFSPREVVARIKALLRRAKPAMLVPERTDESIAGLHYDANRRRFTLRGSVLDLTPSEYTLLRTLMQSPGRVFLRQELLDSLYPAGDIVLDRVVDVHIAKLRQKLGDDPNEPIYIHTVRGLGYRFADTEAV